MSAWPCRIAREQRVMRSVLASMSVVLLAGACDSDDYGDEGPTQPAPLPTATVVSASGAILAKVDEFRALAGEPRNGGTVPGPAPSGRREVTWDGVVFADVDVANATKLEAFDKSGRSLGVFPAPVRTDATGHSFIGIKFASAIIARVRITSGTAALGAQALDSATSDLVVMDDFIYAEPVPLPQ